MAVEFKSPEGERCGTVTGTIQRALPENEAERSDEFTLSASNLPLKESPMSEPSKRRNSLLTLRILVTLLFVILSLLFGALGAYIGTVLQAPDWATVLLIFLGVAVGVLLFAALAARVRRYRRGE
jgi:pilus assembly protein TadC